MDGRLKYVTVNEAELFADSALSLQLDVTFNFKMVTNSYRCKEFYSNLELQSHTMLSFFNTDTLEYQMKS